MSAEKVGVDRKGMIAGAKLVAEGVLTGEGADNCCSARACNGTGVWWEGEGLGGYVANGHLRDGQSLGGIDAEKAGDEISCFG
jgi:hypothetical protein